ncbi:hypothetical protein JMI89_07760 [Frischella sp. Ac48]|uniref:hypothetical protein n=1 Tax=Frischella sp. Ac48 TaxID=2804531 RepID=UPI001C7D67BA|nr:hypothetical protein [Frischella sp. Ac48]MBX4133524.1 hypothetical protein [Frischella sp. Ac48]
MKQWSLVSLKTILLILIIVPSFLVAGMIDFSTKDWSFWDLSEHISFIIICFVLTFIATNVDFMLFRDESYGTPFLLNSVIYGLIISFIAILSPPMAYFIRIFAIYNLIVLIFFFIRPLGILSILFN